MDVLIIEDEFPAAERLQKLIHFIDDNINIVGIQESVKSAKAWFSSNPLPDLIFADIQLSDGLSFEIFDAVPIQSPIIFTTSYDEYALKAFKLKSIDYLLKPLKKNELSDAIEKYKELQKTFRKDEYALRVESLMDQLLQDQRKFKTCFLVKYKDELIPIQQKQISYFFYSNRMVCLTQNDGKQFLVDYSLEELEALLDPAVFCHINRQYIINISSVHKIHTHFNGMLKLELLPKSEVEVMISRDKAKLFKRWMEGS
ncbi:MAG TPA: LytTR family DNA-binding domain-containing protein [Cytophagaceae bacterium]|jgi:DNA-binding LytR/AlgR family response regulator